MFRKMFIVTDLVSLSYWLKQILEILSLKGDCTGLSESTLVKCHIVGNHMSMFNCHGWQERSLNSVWRFQMKAEVFFITQV